MENSWAPPKLQQAFPNFALTATKKKSHAVWNSFGIDMYTSTFLTKEEVTKQQIWNRFHYNNAVSRI